MTTLPTPQTRPFDPHRPGLYTPEELLTGYDGTFQSTRDFAIYRHFSDFGRRAPSREEAHAERLHDWSIDEALRSFLNESNGGFARGARVTAIMGGHGKMRGEPEYTCVTRLAHRLALGGFTVASGGGPGIMEAANLGAYLAGYDRAVVDDAIKVLAREVDYRMPAYFATAQEVRSRHPNWTASLAVPTWFYGHEPTNLFGSHIAKYFSNGLREDTLLAIARAGVVFAAGRAGTWQEIFMDLAQNFYKTYDVLSPMVFLGRDHYEIETGLAPIIRKLASWSAHGAALEELILVTDDVDEAVEFLVAKAPPP